MDHGTLIRLSLMSEKQILIVTVHLFAPGLGAFESELLLPSYK